MTLESLLDEDRITVERQTASRDSSGGATRTWTLLYDSVAARVEDVSATQQYQFAMRQMLVSHRVFTQQGGISVRDRILTSDGRYLVVEGVNKMRGIGGIDTFYEVLAGELRPGV